MFKKDVLNHFKTASNVARAIGVSPAAVSKWGRVVPKLSAEEIERVTSGAVRIRNEFYVRGRPVSRPVAVPSQPA